MTLMRANFRYSKLILVAISFLATQTPANEQSLPEKSRKLAGVHFTGLNRYTQEAAVAATGLRIGEPITVQQIVVVQQQLGKSGAFETVAYRYTTHGEELTADFQVKESQNVLPCFFDNFVWFSDAELDHSLRHSVALYTGLSPTSGTTLQEIIDALKALLHSKGIEGTVEEIPFSPHVGVLPDRLLFEVKGVPMPVTSVKFPGASGLTQEQLTSASKEIIGQDFSITHWNEYASYGLVPLYKRNGYLNVRFGDPAGKLLGSAPGDSSVQIDVSLPVEEGLKYFWEKADWTGSRQLTPAELDRLLGMKSKEIANQDKIDAGMAAIQKAYSAHGFIEANLGPKANLNDSDRMASYEFLVNEGTQYHMGQIHFDGVPDRASQELTKAWKLKPGDVFDATYLDDFLQKVGLRKLVEMGLKPSRTIAKNQVDKEKAIVDQYVEFR